MAEHRPELEELDLTEKQKAFCDYYIETLNATESAKRAGYSERSAEVIGFENLRKPKIAEYIQTVMKNKENERIASQNEVLEYLTRVMRAEEVNVYDNVTDDGEVVQITVRPEIKERTRAAELLGRRYALFTDNVNVSDYKVTIIDDI